ncbi:hypothetical protein LLEC1_04377 [Akanthomyces lecanii]|uniref:Nuclear distribution protein PAC1 n=1 Tax=Cordyceps confragosa TaxID=2714763 RepID=A0A179IAQ8_CORDF|nr:hypothetical protein LLEC1_04377 [Akanthomyces lecanii]
MSRSLSAVQAGELNKSILGYAEAQGKTTAASTLRAELNLGVDVFSTAKALQYGQLLEKKWTTVSRLETRAKLEAKHAELESQLECTVPASKRQDPASWIPASQPKFHLASHTDSVNCVAFHHVFSSLASGSDDCTIKIWDWELGELERTIKAHTQAVRDVDFGGPKGAVLLASCSSDLAIKLWDPSDNYNNIRTLKGHGHAITSARFLPCHESDKTLLVSASADRAVRLWNTTTGFCVKVLQGHSDWVRSVCPSDDGQFVLSASSDNTACLWDIHSHSAEATLTLIGHDKAINCCAIATRSSYQYLSSLAGSNMTLPLSNSAGFFATGSRDKSIKLWNADGKCIATLLGHDSWVSALVFHPGGRYIFSAADDKTLRFWDLNQKGQCVNVIPGVHEGFITCLRWIPEIKTLHGQNGAHARRADASNSSTSALPHFRCVIATGGMDKKVKVFLG